MKIHNEVWVVDDDADIRQALLDLLTDSEIPAVGLANGAIALQRLQTSSALPCLIVLDLMMPVMDGIAFREAQLNDARLAAIPVLIISAYRDLDGYAAKLKPAGVLKKPLQFDDLLRTIEQFC